MRLKLGAQVANFLGRHAASSSALARRAPHAGDVRAGVSHEREIVCGELTGERDEQPALVRPCHPRGQRVGRDQRAQARTARAATSTRVAGATLATRPASAYATRMTPQ